MEDLRQAVAEAIRKVSAQVRWKPGKDALHLQKRQAMGHLPAEASLVDDNALIHGIVGNPRARVFVYRAGDSLYAAVRGDAMGRPWVVIFSLTGIIETAFPPDGIDAYLAQPAFTEIGSVGEVLT